MIPTCATWFHECWKNEPIGHHANPLFIIYTFFCGKIASTSATSYEIQTSSMQHEVKWDPKLLSESTGPLQGAPYCMVILDALQTYYFKAGEYIHIIFTDAIISIYRAHIYVLYTPKKHHSYLY